MADIESLDIKIGAELKSKTSAESFEKLALSLEKLQKVADSGLNQIDSLVSNLNKLSNVGNFNTVAKGLKEFTSSMYMMEQITFSKLSDKILKLTNDIKPLQKLKFKHLDSFDSLKSFAKNITSLSTSLEKVEKIDISVFQNIINVLSSLKIENTESLDAIGGIGKGISSLATGLLKLEKINLETLPTSINKIVAAIKPLTNEMLRGGSSASAYGTAMLALSRATKTVDTQAKKSKSGLSGLTKSLSKIGASFFAFRKLANFGKQMFEATASWTENLNLFAITYGGTADPAFKKMSKWVVDLSTQFGFSTNQLLKFTGLFKQLSSSLGIAKETGDELSKTLTQLSLDFSSFYNVDLERSFSTMQSSIFGGQTKTMRQLFGIDTTYQSLDQTLKDMANSYNVLGGISSRMLAQNQKSILRTIAVMQGGVNAFGDMANTTTSLQNQLRVMRGSIDNLKLALGDMVLAEPFQHILKYINAIIIAITSMIRAFVPFKEVQNELSGVTGGFEDLDEEINDTQKGVGKLSFDTIEALDGGGESKENEDLAITGALTEELARQQALYAEETRKAEEHFKSIAGTAQNIAETIKSWFMITDENGGFLEWTDNMKPLVHIFQSLKTVIGIVWEALKPILSAGGGILDLVSSLVQWLDKTNLLVPALLAVAAAFAGIKLAKKIGDLKNTKLGFEQMSASIEVSKTKIATLTTTIDKQTQIVNNNTGKIKTNAQEKLNTANADLKLEQATLKSNEALLKQKKTAQGVSGVMGVLAGAAGIMGVISSTGDLISKWDELSTEQKVIQTASLVLTGVMTGLAIAQATAAIAASWGGAAAGIIAGITVVTAAIVGAMTLIPEFKAEGGTFDTRGGTALGVINERGKGEFAFSNNASQIEVANQQSLQRDFSASLSSWTPMLETAVANAINRANVGGSTVLNIDGRKIGEISSVANGVRNTLVREGKY